MITVFYKGEQTTTVESPDNLDDLIEMADYPAENYTLDPDGLAAWEDAQRVQRVRKKIGETAGDMGAIVGTTADAVQMLLFANASLIIGMSKSVDPALRDAAKPFEARAIDFLAKVNDGRVVLPFMLKGEQATADEIEARVTAVSEAMIAVAYETP